MLSFNFQLKANFTRDLRYILFIVLSYLLVIKGTEMLPNVKPLSVRSEKSNSRV